MSVILETKGLECKECPFYKERVVWGRGSPSAEMMVVADHPKEDDTSPLSGKASFLYKNVLKQSNLTQSEIYITYALKCEVPEGVNSNSKIVTTALDLCKSNFLKKEIKEVNPKVIVTTGELPLRSVLNKKRIGEWRSAVYKKKSGVQIIPTMSLMSVFHQNRFLKIIENDFKKAASILDNPGKSLKKSDIDYVVCTSVDEIKKYISIMKKKTMIAYDIETTCWDKEEGKVKVKGGALLYNLYDIITHQFSYEKNKAIVIPIEKFKRERLWNKKELEEIKSLFKDLFNTRTITWVCHESFMDLRGAYKFCKYNYNKIKFIDTLLLQQTINENDAADLETLAAIYTDLGNYTQELNKKYKGKL